jgi:hypothetical protein
MDLIPPWSRAKRLEWVRAHPWVAGYYFATLMSATFVLPVQIASPSSLRHKVLVGLVAWPMMATLFAIGVKRRWGERPDAEAQPPPSARRMWSLASGRFLLWFMRLGVAGTGVLVVGFVAGVDRSWAVVLGVPCGIWLATTT